MRTGYRIALASVLTLLFGLCGIALILAGKEGYVPKPLQVVLLIVALPSALIPLSARVFPAANKVLSGWVGFIALEFAYSYCLILLAEALFKKLRPRKPRHSDR